MRIGLLLFLISLVMFNADCQKKELTLSFENLPLITAFDSISSISGYFFSYNSEIVQGNDRFSLDVQNVSIEKLLDRLLIGTGLNFRVIDEQVVITLDQASTYQKVRRIGGKVIDKETGESIPGASVFIAGTSIGTATDLSGAFDLAFTRYPNQVITFSFVGYKSERVLLDSIETENDKLNVYLTPELFELETVTVFADSSIRGTVKEVVYRNFKSALLGIGPFSEYCELVNPEVLTIFYTEDLTSIEAKSNQPLIVLNHALGYRISYQIDFFQIINSNKRAHANIDFEELEYEDRKQKREWRRNRREAYRGSLRHFLQSLILNTYPQDGYRIFALDSTKIESKHPFRPLRRDDIIKYTNIPYIFSKAYDGYIFVSYRHESITEAAKDDQETMQPGSEEEILMRMFASSPRIKEDAQLSALRIIGGEIFVDINGNPAQKSGLATLGYWTTQGLSELVPLNYSD